MPCGPPQLLRLLDLGDGLGSGQACLFQQPGCYFLHTLLYSLGCTVGRG